MNRFSFKLDLNVCKLSCYVCMYVCMIFCSSLSMDMGMSMSIRMGMGMNQRTFNIHISLRDNCDKIKLSPNFFFYFIFFQFDHLSRVSCQFSSHVIGIVNC